MPNLISSIAINKSVGALRVFLLGLLLRRPEKVLLLAFFFLELLSLVAVRPSAMLGISKTRLRARLLSKSLLEKNVLVSSSLKKIVVRLERMF